MSRCIKRWYLVFGPILLLSGCSEINPRVATAPNQIATLSGKLPANPLAWRVITSGLDSQRSTMYTLFGNDMAVTYARSHSQHDYPEGSVLSLVTWNQQEDPRWFGARIPAAPKSVEFVSVKAGAVYSYESFEGTPLRQVLNQSDSKPNDRAAYLLSQRAAVMP